jgi:hypothetical protein
VLCCVVLCCVVLCCVVLCCVVLEGSQFELKNYNRYLSCVYVMCY